MHKHVTVRKNFPLPRQDLFSYFVTPALLEKWAFPTGMSLRIPQLEARPGGRYRWEHSNETGTYVAEGHFEELSPERIVQVDEEIEDPTGAVVMEDLLCVITFRDLHGSTEVAVDQSGFTDQKNADQCKQGWEESLANLERLLGKARSRRRPLSYSGKKARASP